MYVHIIFNDQFTIECVGILETSVPFRFPHLKGKPSPPHYNQVQCLARKMWLTISEQSTTSNNSSYFGKQKAGDR